MQNLLTRPYFQDYKIGIKTFPKADYIAEKKGTRAFRSLLNLVRARETIFSSICS